MQTRKLYYEDPFQKGFASTVVSCEEVKGGYAVVLEETAFYPEGGGQPCDVGTLGSANVLDVREKDGVKYYNDSIASSPTRTIAGLNSFQQKVILIAGGYDKHIPYDVLGQPICDHVKLLLLTGATAPKIRECVENIEGEHPPIVEVENLETAVQEAAARAESGDVVIMSPASASFDRFKNFMERGKLFKALVEEL